VIKLYKLVEITKSPMLEHLTNMSVVAMASSPSEMLELSEQYGLPAVAFCILLYYVLKSQEKRDSFYRDQTAVHNEFVQSITVQLTKLAESVEKSTQNCTECHGHMMQVKQDMAIIKDRDLYNHINTKKKEDAS